MSTIQNLEAGLKKQLADLAEQIRTAETTLIATKEGYLKVSGALEILDILKKEEAALECESSASAGLSD